MSPARNSASARRGDATACNAAEPGRMRERCAAPPLWIVRLKPQTEPIPGVNAAHTSATAAWRNAAAKPIFKGRGTMQDKKQPLHRLCVNVMLQEKARIDPLGASYWAEKTFTPWWRQQRPGRRSSPLLQDHCRQQSSAHRSVLSKLVREIDLGKINRHFLICAMQARTREARGGKRRLSVSASFPSPPPTAAARSVHLCASVLLASSGRNTRTQVSRKKRKPETRTWRARSARKQSRQPGSVMEVSVVTTDPTDKQADRGAPVPTLGSATPSGSGQTHPRSLPP